MVLPDCSLDPATSDLKSVEFYPNKKYDHPDKVKIGHRMNQKVATGKRLQWFSAVVLGADGTHRLHLCGSKP